MAITTTQPAKDTNRAWLTAMAITGVAMAGFSAVFSTLGLRQFWRFHSHAFDLGIFGQGTWLLSRFHDPFVTLRGLGLFADHSSYILVLAVPLYWVFPTPATLIVVGVIALVCTAPAAFAIARHAGAGPSLSTATAVLVLLQPALELQVLDSFHPEVLVIPLAVAAVALLQRDRDGWAIAAVLLSLTAKEDVGLLIVPLGLVVAWVMHKHRTGFVIAAAGAGAFLLNFAVLLPAWSPTGELLYSYRYEALGESPTAIAVGLLTKPNVWWEVMSDPKRLVYIALVVLAMPLCILAPRWLLVGVPTMLANLFSTHGYQHEIRYHYTAYLIVVVVIAGAYGAGRVGSWGRRSATIGAIVASVLMGSCVWIAAGTFRGWASAHPHQDQIREIVDVVPEGASISAWTTLATHFTDRQDVYLFPNPWQEYDYGLQGPYDVPYGDIPDPRDVDWIFVRFDSYRTFDDVIEEIRTSGEFDVVIDDPPFLLMRRIG